MQDNKKKEKKKKEKEVNLKPVNKSTQDVDDLIFEDEGYKCSER